MTTIELQAHTHVRLPRLAVSHVLRVHLIYRLHTGYVIDI